MLLIEILLVAVSALAFLSGTAVLVGASKSSRLHSLAFFLTSFGVFGWSLSMSIFMSLENPNPALLKGSVFGIYLSTLVMDLFFMIYVGNKVKWSRLPIIFAALGSLALGAVIVVDPTLLYSEIVIDGVSNAVKVRLDWWYIAFTLFTMFEGVMIAAMVFWRTRHSTSDSKKRGWTIFLITLSAAWMGAGVFDLILPPFRYDLIWIGPLLVSIDFVIHYYSILKYHLLELSGLWLKVLSHVIVMTLAAVVYLSAFFIIFVSIFNVSSPSLSVLLLNAVMVVFVLVLFPAINEILSYTRSLSSVQSVDIVYLVKKFNALSREYINYHELAEFLVEHLHFQYVGLIVDKKLYGSKEVKICSAVISDLASAKPSKGLWLKFDEAQKEALKKTGVEAVAVLRNNEGEELARVLVGRPFGGMNFNSRDITEVETALTLLAVAMSSNAKFK